MTQHNNRDILGIDPEDAVLVFKRDGSYNLSLPTESVMPPGQHVMHLAVMLYAIQNDDLYTQMVKAFDNACNENRLAFGDVL